MGTVLFLFTFPLLLVLLGSKGCVWVEPCLGHWGNCLARGSGGLAALGLGTARSHLQNFHAGLRVISSHHHLRRGSGTVSPMSRWKTGSLELALLSPVGGVYIQIPRHSPASLDPHPLAGLQLLASLFATTAPLWVCPRNRPQIPGPCPYQAHLEQAGLLAVSPGQVVCSICGWGSPAHTLLVFAHRTGLWGRPRARCVQKCPGQSGCARVLGWLFSLRQQQAHTGHTGWS